MSGQRGGRRSPWQRRIPRGEGHAWALRGVLVMLARQTGAGALLGRVTNSSQAGRSAVLRGQRGQMGPGQRPPLIRWRKEGGQKAGGWGGALGRKAPPGLPEGAGEGAAAAAGGPRQSPFLSQAERRRRPSLSAAAEGDPQEARPEQQIRPRGCGRCGSRHVLWAPQPALPTEGGGRSLKRPSAPKGDPSRPQSPPPRLTCPPSGRRAGWKGPEPAHSAPPALRSCSGLMAIRLGQTAQWCISGGASHLPCPRPHPRTPIPTIHFILTRPSFASSLRRRTKRCFSGGDSSVVRAAWEHFPKGPALSRLRTIRAAPPSRLQRPLEAAQRVTRRT